MKYLFKSLFVIVCSFALSTCNVQKQTNKIENVIVTVSKKFVPDKRVAVFNIEVKRKNKRTFILKGETNLKEAYNFLLDTLAEMKVQIVDSIRFLPAAQLGEKVWGLATLSAVPMLKIPEYSAEMVSQAIFGTPVKLLEEKDGWYRIQTPDKYIGWVTRSGIARFSQTEIEAWKASCRYVFTKMSGSVLTEAKENAAPVSDMVLGSIFEVVEKTNGFLKIRFPDKREGFVRATDCMAFNDWKSATPDVEKIIETAKEMLGNPYLWGGTSTKSVDCSGLIKTSYFSQGIMLARDASQQALYGEKLDIDNFRFQPGDLLFFGQSIDHITHVGLFIGNSRFIHSSGRVKINSLNPNDGDFEPDRKKELVAARRVLNSLNTGQIIPIKDHPWYN